MQSYIFPTKEQMGISAAEDGIQHIQAAIEQRGKADIILATGTSQLATIEHLSRGDIDWSKVAMFHLDEYIGLGMDHPASFRGYLKKEFVDHVGPLRAVHYVNGNAADPQAECDRLNALLRDVTIDVAMVGIGENGHLAFNDPPADFDTEQPYIIVELDQRCRAQQLGEGWFATLEDVPERAISMSIRQIMKSRQIVCSVPDTRKAEAVRRAVTGPVTNLVPASILQEHPTCRIYLDESAASQLHE